MATAQHKIEYLWILFLAFCSAGTGGCAACGQRADVECQLERFAIDYNLTRSGAREDECLLRRFFLVSLIVDAAGAEQYGSDLDDIVDAVGDERFLEVLQSCGSEVESGVLEVIRHSRGLDQSGDDWSEFIVRHPRLGNYLLAALPRPPGSND